MGKLVTFFYSVGYKKGPRGDRRGKNTTLTDMVPLTPSEITSADPPFRMERTNVAWFGLIDLKYCIDRYMIDLKLE